MMLETVGPNDAILNKGARLIDSVVDVVRRTAEVWYQHLIVDIEAHICNKVDLLKLKTYFVLFSAIFIHLAASK